MEVLEKHKCKVMRDKELPIEEQRIDGFYGPVIFDIVKTSMGWIAHNGEYASHVWHCPFCGEKLD
jgi:hypothetical protein